MTLVVQGNMYREQVLQHLVQLAPTTEWTMDVYGEVTVVGGIILGSGYAACTVLLADAGVVLHLEARPAQVSQRRAA